MNKEQSIKQVDECISSIFSKEDVKQIIEKIDTKTPDVGQLFKVLDKAFHNTSDHIEVEVENICFDFSGDQDSVSVDSIQLDKYCFEENSIDKFLSKFKDEIKRLLQDEEVS
jgi:hypothetical protein